MAVSNGQPVNATVTNGAFLSRTQDSDTIAVVGLKNAGSGGDINNTQQQINDNIADIATNTADIAARALLTDTRFPTANEKAALAGTQGSPSDANRYVTDQDKRLFTDETILTINNNQAATDLTGLSFNSTNNHGAVIFYLLRRRTDSSERVAIGKLSVLYLKDAASWEIVDENNANEDHGVTFTISAAGQVRYETDDMAGANYYGKITFKNLLFNEVFTS